MWISAELINDNGISAVALAFFSALFTATGAAVVGIFQIKSRTGEARDAAISAQEKATETVANTQNVANGFVSRMDGKLDQIARGQEELGKAFREHLEWHLEREGK